MIYRKKKICLYVQCNFLNNDCIFVGVADNAEIAKSNKSRIMKENFVAVFSHECLQLLTVDTVIILISSIFGL